MLNDIVRYFDLQSPQRSVTPKGVTAAPRTKHAGEPSAKHAPVLPQYAAVATGVLVDPLLRSYIDSATFNFDFWSLLARAGFALLMAILLLPAVYKNAFDPDKPLLVQLCALFTSGVGWQSLFQTAAEAAGG
ncbi:MAG: hypothetical protein ACREC3_16970 [Methyloceanibacter sp.]